MNWLIGIQHLWPNCTNVPAALYLKSYFGLRYRYSQLVLCARERVESRYPIGTTALGRHLSMMR